MTGTIGGAAGALIQGGSELLGQLSSNGWALSEVNWNKVGRESAYGAGKGALIGATGGFGFAAAVGAGAVGGAVETAVERGVQGQGFSVAASAEGGLWGAFEGGLGSGVILKAAGGRSVKKFAEQWSRATKTGAAKMAAGRLGKETTAAGGAALSGKTAEGFGIAIQLIVEDQPVPQESSQSPGREEVEDGLLP